MPFRLSLEDLLLAGVPCTSSSFVSTSTRGSGTDGTNAGTSDWTQGGAEVAAINRKRKGKSPEVIGELKQAKVERKLVNDSWFLVGRLLLWNRTASSHPGTGSNSLDCLALCDGATAVCCTVHSLDVELLGQYVQVNSWRFVPTVEYADKNRDANEAATSSEAFPRPERGGTYESGNPRVLPESLDCGGWLEIHSLELLDQPSQATAQVFDFPSLCLSPVGANAPNLALETPEKRKDKRKPRLWIWGLLHCMGPPFLLPANSSLQNAPEGRSLSKRSYQNSLNVQSDTRSLLGLLVELRMCGSIWQPKHQQSAINAWTCRYSAFLEQEAVDAGRHGTVAIYFLGAVASWRPLLGEMLGGYVAVTGLRRKVFQLGPQMGEVLIYVATRKTLVFRINPTWVDSSTFKVGDAGGLCEHKNSNRRQDQPDDDLPRLDKVVPDGEASSSSGRGLGSYVGKITSVLMQGAILEVDDKVWLLLTHYKHTQVHGLRVGALVAVRHAHIMPLRSVSEKVLVLGPCVRSHVVVVHYPISSAGSLNSQVPQSRLNKYVGSLPFAWAFWVLHVITSLKLKLRGVYSDTELLGSMKHSGLIRKVLPSMMAAPVTLHRDAFKEFLLHEQFCRLGDTSATVILSKIPALSNFCKLVEMLWADPVSSIWHDDQRRNDDNCDFGPNIARPSKPTVSGTSCYVRNIISGVELDVVLVGSLKVSEATGKLQLVDATGALDVVVSDIRSFSNLHSVYQISEYKLVMEGDYTCLAESAAWVSRNVSAPISWSSLLKGSVIGTSEPSSFSYYAKFDLRHAKRLEGLTWPSNFEGHKSEVAENVHKSRDVKNESIYTWKGKEFHIALITHKCPAREKFSADKEIHWAFDVEVVLLPYRLLVHQDHGAPNDILNPISENLDSSSSKVQRATKTSRLEELGGMGARAQSAMEASPGCLIECSVRCLEEQSSGLRKSPVQPSRTFMASLFSKACSPSAPISGSFCGSKEKHWAAISEAKLQKVLLAVNWRAIEMSQMFNTGDWCLLPTSQDNLSSGMSLECRRVEIDAEQPLISLQWRCAGDGQSIEPDIEESLQTAASNGGTTSTFVLPCEPSLNGIDATDSVTESEGDSSTLKLGRCSDDDLENMSGSTSRSQPQLVDVELTVSDSFRHELRRWLVSLKRELIPELLNVSEALQLCSHTATMLPNYGNSVEERSDISGAVKLEASSGILSLQGEVVSIQGKLEMTECSGHPSSAGYDDLSKFSFSRSSAGSQWRKTLVQLRDLRTDHMIRIDINFDKYITPAGFGPGAVACFRRVLLRRGENVLVHMPTTDVVIVSVEKRSRDFSHESQRPSTTSLSSQEHEGCAENGTCVDLLKDFISELEPRNKFLKVHCRVVSVQGLEFEWQNSPPLSVGHLPSDMVSVQEDLVTDVAVKWGCFIIDDGSAVAECWARGDQAANLLGFRELARNLPPFCPSIYALASKIPFFKDQQSGQSASLMQLLRFLVRKHKRVCVQGEPPQGDTGTTSWLMKGIDSDLAESEATLLKLILEQACQLGPKVVHCTPLSDNDSDFRSAEGQACFPTMSNMRPWQNLTWSRTQLVATKVDVVNVWVGLQQLASSFDI